MAKVQGDKVSARERVRLRRLELDRERIERDQLVDQVAEEFFVASGGRDNLLEEVRQREAEMAVSIARLLDLREAPARVQQLLELDVKEYRRLAGLVESDQLVKPAVVAPAG
ncbi:hypothetical protein [Agromyces sp. Soil535]|uniref:hypothetical protein n=1 Tax=Agromyces sp. Soil535 TaxID=1736390 RepID=UPI0006F3E720|nr:hypothetical protein [Agromyces sp. Soil535]KRE28258.1 hypothetical protein ASG80_21505 [Agromyces sp. Soil535]